MKILLTAIFVVMICSYALSQDKLERENRNPVQAGTFSYAYITVEGKGLSNKLNVEVDLGDSPEQIETGKEYSKTLTNKRSYAAVLNYMGERMFELVATREESITIQGTSSPYKIMFIMKRKNF